MSDAHPVVVRGVRITEPATMITDFVIAAMCVGFAIVTERSTESFATARGLWGLSFAFAGIAAMIGGVVHGFVLYLTADSKQRLWKATQRTLGLTALAILVAAVVAFVDGELQRWLVGLAVAKFVWYATVVRKRDDYAIVVLDYGVSMLALVALATIGWVRTSSPASPWLIAGVAISGAAAVVQLKKIAPHRRFNHNDLYHAVQVIALYLFYRGGLLLVER
jgi:hypothetical protein